MTKALIPPATDGAVLRASVGEVALGMLGLQQHQRGDTYRGAQGVAAVEPHVGRNFFPDCSEGSSQVEGLAPFHLAAQVLGASQNDADENSNAETTDDAEHDDEGYRAIADDPLPVLVHQALLAGRHGTLQVNDEIVCRRD